MTAETMPIMPGTRAVGNSSRMMPKVSGKIAPAKPCSTRAKISTSRLGAKAAMRLPTAIAPTEMTNMRRLPIMSPMRPNSGVATAAVISQAVTVQVTAGGGGVQVLLDQREHGDQQRLQ